MDHVELMDYLRACPEKLLTYLDEHIADDDLQAFLRGFWDFARNDPAGGPTLRAWRERGEA